MNDELFDVIESNEHYDLYILDQILSGEYEPDTEELDAIYSEQNPEVEAKKPVYADIPYNPEGDEIPDELAAMLAERQTNHLKQLQITSLAKWTWTYY